MKFQALTKLISVLKSALQKVWAVLTTDVKVFIVKSCSKSKGDSAPAKKQASTSTSGKRSANKAKPQSKKKKLT